MKRVFISSIVAALLGQQSEAISISKTDSELPKMNHDHRLAQTGQTENEATNEKEKQKNQQEVVVKEVAANKIEIMVQQKSEAKTDTKVNTEVKTDTVANANATATADAQSDAQLDVSADLSPDVYGPNGDDYSNNRAGYDFSRIGIDIKTKTDNAKCMPGFYMKAHWIGSLQSNGVVFEDTHQGVVEHVTEPKLFYLGNYQHVQCLELAFQQLRPGEKAHVTCPSYYAYGGAFTLSKLGSGQPLPLHADVEYDVEVEDCNLDPSKFEAQQAAKIQDEKTPQGLKGDRCFYLHTKKETSSTDLVLTCEDQDWVSDPHFSHYPGIHCYLEEFVRDNQNQQWYYDEHTGYIKDAAHGFYLVNDHGILMLADMDHLHFDDPYFDPWFPRQKQSFEFCPWENVLETFINGVHSWVGAVPDIGLRHELEYHPFTEGTLNSELQEGAWKIEYCWQNF